MNSKSIIETDEFFMKQAIALSALAVEHGNEPFGAVLAKNGEIVFSSENQIYTKHVRPFMPKRGLFENLRKKRV